MADRDEGERLPRLYRRWVRARARTNARGFGVGAATRDLRLLLLVTPFAVAGFLGRPDNPLVAWVRHLPAVGVAVGLAALWGVNGLLADRWLARQAGPSRPAWRRLAAFSVGSLPCLGLLLLSAGVRRRSSFAEDAERVAEPLARTIRDGRLCRLRCRLGADRRLHAFERSLAWPVWTWGVNFLALVALVTWLQPPPGGGARAVAAWLLTQVLRGAAIVATAGWAFRRMRRLPPLRRAAAGLAPVACLLPMEWAALPLFSMIAVGIDKERERGLVFVACREDLIRASRLSRWLRLGWSLSRARREAVWWRRWRVPRAAPRTRAEATAGDVRRRRVAALRVVLGFFEFAGLGIALSWLDRAVPGIAAALGLGGVLMLALAAVTGAVGLAVSEVRDRSTGSSAATVRWPFGALCAAASAGSWGLLAGLAGGPALVQLTGGFFFFASAVSFVRNPFVHRGGEWAPLLWVGFYVLVGVLTLAMVRAAPVAVRLASSLETIATAAPLGGAAVGGLMVRALRAPWATAGSARPWSLVSLILATPLGGLAVPWWLHRIARPCGSPQEAR